MRPARALAATLIVGGVAVSCTSDEGTVARGECPVDPVEVVVTVDPWGDVVERLGGDCTVVTTIIESSAIDPHDFEPSPAERARVDDARLVVVNGLGYDGWAELTLASQGEPPAVVDAGRLSGRDEGANPHLWYSPDTVRAVARAVTDGLGELLPDATAYLEARHAAWTASLVPYDELIASISTAAAGATYAATESVFDDMATAVGLTDVTPAGFRRAARNESEPSPADLAAFETALKDGSVDVLIDNLQTEGPASRQLRATAEDAAVPVVEVTETLPPGADGFVDWQVAQLEALAEAVTR